MSKDSLENSLLLADPSLQGSVFNRSVIHLAEHSLEDGAMGYIMNKPTGKNVGEVLQGDMFQGLEHIPIYFGGPVRPDQIMFSAYWWAPDGEFSYRLRISAEEAVTMKSSAGCLLLAHVGHAGWSPGQLENELDEQSWVNTAVASEVISLNATKLWQSLLAQVSPFHALLSRTPQELRVN